MKNKSEDKKKLSAYEKAEDEGVDPRCIPQKLTGPVPEHDEIVYPDYPESDQETWRFLYKRQIEILPDRACEEYMNGAYKLNLSPDRIPYLKKDS